MSTLAEGANDGQRQLPSLSFRLAPEPSHLLRARERIRDYLRAHCDDRGLTDQVVLCIEEACTNAIRHSGSREDMLVSLHFEDADLVVTVEDRGRGFDTAAFDPEALPDPMATGGRGLFLIARMMDDIELRTDGGLEVRMMRRGAACGVARPSILPSATLEHDGVTCQIAARRHQ